MTRIVRDRSSPLQSANKTTPEEPDSLRQTQTRGQRPGAASTQKPKSLNLHNDVSFAGGARHTTTQTQTQTPDNARRRTTKRSRLRPRARLARPLRPRLPALSRLMLDDEARRSLEEEAIALVNLSNPKKLIIDSEDAHSALVLTPCHQHNDSHTALDVDGAAGTAMTGGGAIHPLLQIKANLIARRDGKMAARKLNIRDQNDKDACVSMELYVQADTGVTHKDKRGRTVASSASLGLTAMSEENPVDDSNISMKSLLVTLKKKRRLHPKEETKPSVDEAGTPPPAEADAVDATKLPSFRSVFESPLQPPASASSAAGSSTQQLPPALTPMELKCKYRTGKCSNVRALKSCGDYHNLCNYHRLRANANQRKLDRKKKVQRQQLSTSSASACTSAASSPTAVGSSPISAVPSSAAAAAALASLPTSLGVKPEQRQFEVATLLPYYAAAPAAVESSQNSLRPKEEDACTSY